MKALPFEEFKDERTGFIPKEKLPGTLKTISAGPEWLDYLSGPDKAMLMLENLMAKGGAGHARRLRTDTEEALHKMISYAIDIHSGLTEDFLEKNKSNKELLAWNERYKKFLQKQKKKGENYAINITNIPYRATREEIESLIDDLLGSKGNVQAIDPWWCKDAWRHDGGCTIYVKKEHAEKLLELANTEKITMDCGTGKRHIRINPGHDGKLTRREGKVEDVWD